MAKSRDKFYQQRTSFLADLTDKLVHIADHVVVNTHSRTALSVNQVQMAGSVKFEAASGRQEGGAALRFDENWVLGGHKKFNCFILANLSMDLHVVLECQYVMSSINFGFHLAAFSKYSSCIICQQTLVGVPGPK